MNAKNKVKAKPASGTQDSSRKGPELQGRARQMAKVPYTMCQPSRSRISYGPCMHTVGGSHSASMPTEHSTCSVGNLLGLKAAPQSSALQNRTAGRMEQQAQPKRVLPSSVPRLPFRRAQPRANQLLQDRQRPHTSPRLGHSDIQQHFVTTDPSGLRWA
jgi:hypothetical protein